MSLQDDTKAYVVKKVTWRARSRYQKKNLRGMTDLCFFGWIFADDLQNLALAGKVASLSQSSVLDEATTYGLSLFPYPKLTCSAGMSMSDPMDITNDTLASSLVPVHYAMFLKDKPKSVDKLHIRKLNSKARYKFFCLFTWYTQNYISCHAHTRAPFTHTHNRLRTTLAHTPFSRERLRRVLHKKAAVVIHLQIYIFSPSHPQM